MVAAVALIDGGVVEIWVGEHGLSEWRGYRGSGGVELVAVLEWFGH
jgi:hypothetical protein